MGVAEGDECPYHCPYVHPMDCGEGMTNCPGPVDSMGCMMPDTCMIEGEECPFYCPYMPPTDCGEGMINCPGPVDSMGCMMPDSCIAEGDICCPSFSSYGLRRWHDQLPSWHGHHGMRDA